VEEGDCLLTAHHQDDQAETLLIQLLRGAGPRGLAAMPAFANFQHGWHARPLLAYSRDELLDYAQQAQLSWIDDESNSDTRFDRNFLRHEIMPRLKSRFPAMASTLSRSAGLCAEAAELLANMAADDLSRVRLDEDSVSVSSLQIMGEVRARNLLHQWCRDRGLSTPTAAQLQCVWDEVIGASADSEPVVSWAGGEARRYRDALFMGSPLAAHDATQSITWDGHQRLLIPALGSALGELHVEQVLGQGISPAALENRRLEIRFRQGGEQLRPVGREGHHALKKLFQEAGIPPWLRDRIPLLYADDQLLAVAGRWVAHEAAAKPDELGVCLRWSAMG
jgi:tRNA(Ile)-lysidine synthase